MGIIVPSGIYTDQGCQPLREMFFEKSVVQYLYCFENRKAIFNIHRSFKFVLFGTQKGGTTEQFKCAFMEHNPEWLSIIERNALQMSVEQVRKFSPDTLSVMEFKSQRDIDVTTKIYGDWPLLGSGHNFTVAREIDLTGHMEEFLKKTKTKGPKLYEGKMIWIFDSDFASSSFWFTNESYSSFYARDSINRAVEFSDLSKKEMTKRVIKEKVELAPDRFRIAFREVAADTNERTFISAILPKPSPHSYTIRTIELYHPKIINDQIKIYQDKPNHVLLYITGVFNSFVFDFVARVKTSNHLSTTYMDLPLPNYRQLKEQKVIIQNAARLTCTDKVFAEFWKTVMDEDTTMLSSSFRKELNVYGPAHEQEIRKRLREEAESLTAEWGPHCGVYDRLPDRRDTGDRAQLRAEIDAYVAHLYGLSRDDFSYILDTFPVLKKKEMKAFGEFMSKRKCLEEYDRIGKVLENE
jgi:chorismate mutase